MPLQGPCTIFTLVQLTSPKHQADFSHHEFGIAGSTGLRDLPL